MAESRKLTLSHLTLFPLLEGYRDAVIAVQRRVENCSSVVGGKTLTGRAGTGLGLGRTMSGRGTKFWM